MSDQQNNKLAVMRDPDQIQAMAKKFTPILRELIVNGRRLSDEQIVGRAIFAATEGLDPVTEVQTLTDRDGKTMCHQMGMNGYRRKCLEQLNPGDEISLEFAEIKGDQLPKGAAYGYECRLRDGSSYGQWQKRLIQVGNAVRQAMGGEITFQQLMELVGPPPVSTGVGLFWLDEFNAYKDKNFPPQERAKKRAERNARAKRFPTSATIYDTGDASPIVAGDAIDGQFVDKPTEYHPDLSKLSKDALIDSLGFEPEKKAEPPAVPASARPAEMTIEEAEAEESTTYKTLYGYLPTEKLSTMRLGMSKAKNPTPEQARKIKAVGIILEARAKGRPVMAIEPEPEPQPQQEDDPDKEPDPFAEQPEIDFGLD